MSDIRITEEPLEIFRMVLRSLESHRPLKAEQDVLHLIQKQYQLGSDPSRWPDQLVKNNISVDDFLKYVLEDVLAPFVEMVIEIWEFLHRHVSTTGGRTQHFLIESEDLTKPWSFDVSRLPRKVRWIQAWMDVRVEQVTIDWEAIGKCLVIDNGIFYGSIERKRLVQSLIIARRDGAISRDMMRLGDQVYEAIRRAARAWYLSISREMAGDNAAGMRTFLPSIAADLGIGSVVVGDRERQGYVDLDLDVALSSERGTYAPQDVFVGPSRGLEIVTNVERDYGLQAAIFFCALWGLDERSFGHIASLLRAHEERQDLLRGSDLELIGRALGDALLARLSAAITPSGTVTNIRELGRQRLDLLLLPYWKDRWFLFEVWSLIYVLRQAESLGAKLELRGIRADSDPAVIGIIWHLPTQKASEPVAIASSQILYPCRNILRLILVLAVLLTYMR